MPASQESHDDFRTKLLQNIRLQLPQLEDLLRQADGYSIVDQGAVGHPWQAMILRICTALQNLLPDRPMNEAFCKMVVDGAGQEITAADNQNRVNQRNAIDAFVRAQFFLKIVCKKGREWRTMPDLVDRDWGALLKLFDLQ
jgi:hypothetical protein